MSRRTHLQQMIGLTLITFLTSKTVERVAGNQVTVNLQTLPRATTVLVLGYE